MSKIKNVFARQLIDSRGNPTIEVEITTELDNVARAIIPSGASTGIHEAHELRDNDKKKWNGKSVLNAVENVNKVIKPKLIGLEVLKQEEIDKKLIELDGTKNKKVLGANAILGVSIAVAKAAAKDLQLPLWKYITTLSNETPTLPVPMLNVMNGGKHAANKIDFQEYMLFPLGAPNFNEALRWSSEIFFALEKILKSKNLNTNKGDEGGYAPDLDSNVEPLKYIKEAIINAGYEPGKDVYIALDPASSEFYDEETKMYVLESENRSLSSEEMIEYYEKMIEEYPIISIEDGLAEEDWSGWEMMTSKLGNKIQLVGDDLFVTNIEFLQKGIDTKVGNAILIKPNQIGTLTETMKAIKLAKENGYNSIMSHRSGESEDSFIADLAVGLNTQQIKTGSMSRSERISKYNQLIRISESVKEYKDKSSLGKVSVK